MRAWEVQPVKFFSQIGEMILGCIGMSPLFLLLWLLLKAEGLI